MPPFGTEAFDALDVAVDLLGTGRASRLYQVLVRDQHLAQDVAGFAIPFVGGAAILQLEGTARPGVQPEVLERALFAEVDHLAVEGPTAEELQRVRNLRAAGVESSLERAGERADRLSQYTCLFDQPDLINSEVSRYAAVDASRVRDGMAAVLRPDNRVVVTYLPAES
jgi:predicted Zn-dependent peptidase